MRRFFVKNILFVIAVNVLVKPVWVLLIDRNVQNRVAGGDYGTYQALLSLSIIFQIVLDFGITSYNSRVIAQNPGKLATLFPPMLSARLALMGIYIALAYGWAWVIGYRGGELALLTGILLFQSLNALLSFLRSNIAALHRFKIDGILSITDRLLMIGACGFLLLYPATAGRFKIEWFVITQIASYAVTAVAAYLVLRKIAGVRLRLSFHAPTVAGIIKESLPYALLIFQMSIYNRADAIMIHRLCTNGKEQADIWASAFRLLDMANMFGLMFATMLLPLYGRMLSQKHDVQPIVKLCVNLLLPVSFVVSTAGICFSGDIMHLLYKGAQGTQSRDHQVVFSWLIASFPAWCLMYIYSTLLTANGNLKTMNYIALGGVVFNLSLNYYLIPRLQATGGAITSLLTQSLLSLAFLVACSRILKLSFNAGRVGGLLGYLAFVIAVAYGVVNFVHAQWIWQATVLFAISFVMLFVFRFVSVGSVKALMERE
ncbi:MAG: polysaccharide biosynthesis protein [Taibaiella sp.]|nr:polysaccharide biosynthesis protein [Taibaiella sp.]